MNFHTVVALLLAAHATLLQPLLAAECDVTISRTEFIDRVYNANLEYIQKGVPSRAVDSFFRRAIINVIHKCSCEDALLDVMCTRLYFGADDKVRTLEGIVKNGFHHDQQVGRVAYFPLYQKNHSVKRPTPRVLDFIEKNATRLKLFLTPLDATQILLVNWNEPIFPSEDDLFKANGTTMAHACQQYYRYVTPSQSRNTTAKKTIAFALGVVQIIRYAGGNVHAANGLLSEYTRYVYNAAICRQESGSNLPIPGAALGRLIRLSKHLLSVALEDLYNHSPGDFLQLYQYHLPAPTDLENVLDICTPPLRLFPELVDQFASIASGGLAATYLDFETSEGNSLTVRLTEDLLSSINPYKYMAF